jgi:Alginate export
VRKYLAIILGVLFVLSFSATAFAIHETQPGQDIPVVSMGSDKITLSGSILERGWYLNNVDQNLDSSIFRLLPKESQSHAFYTTNATLAIDAKVSDNVRGMIEFETGSRNSDLYVWGGGNMGDYDSKPDTNVTFRQLWIQYTGSGLGMPSGIKIGHMPISLSEKQFLNNERFGDDAILVWIDPTKELHLVAGTTKLNEGDPFVHSDDLDGYVLIATYMLNKDNTIGINYLWAHSDGNMPSLGSYVNIDNLNFNNVGVHANGNVAGLSYAAEGDFQFGKIKKADLDMDGDLEGNGDLKAKGWAVFAKLGYQLDPVNLRAAFAMGSGDNNGEDTDLKEFQTLQGTDYDFASRLVHYTQIYERTVATAAGEACLTTQEGCNHTNTGIANTTYYNLGFDVNPVKELGISVDGFILRATKTGLWGDGVSKNLGWEVDSKITYKLAKNLTYFVEAGLFKPGKFYEEALDSDTLEPLVANKKTVTQAVHGLELTF